MVYIVILLTKEQKDQKVTADHRNSNPLLVFPAIFLRQSSWWLFRYRLTEQKSALKTRANSRNADGRLPGKFNPAVQQK